jgi:YVTN family beta-propeller protein
VVALPWGLRALIEFRILGPLEAVEDGRPVMVAAPKVRALLAVLLLHRGEVVSTDRLIDALWGERASPTAVKTVQVYVSNLRKALGDGLLVTEGRGYMLLTEQGQTDVDRFEALVAQGRQALEEGDALTAASVLREALGVWRGPALADFAYESFAQPEIARLEEARLAALEDRIDADLASGERARLVGELEGLVREYPLRERLRGQLMLALYRSGRQADALEAYRDARCELLDGLGLEPGRALADLERAILAHDPALDGAGGSIAQKSPDTAHSRLRGGALIGAAGALLLVVLIAVAVKLASSGASLVRVAPNSLAAIDVRSDRVTAVVPVGSPPGPVAFGSGSLWVANAADQTVLQVDPVAQRMVRTLSVGATPTGIAASRDAIWVIESVAGVSSVAVRRIDPQFDVLGPARRVANVFPGGPGWVAASGTTVWVAPSSGLLARFNASSGRIVRQLDPNASPAGIALGYDAIWVTDSDANNVTQIDATGLRTPIAVGNGPTAIAAGAGGVWVADTFDDRVARIDPSTAAVTTTIPVGRSPSAIAVGDGAVWVANAGDGTVSRIDPATDKVTAIIDVGGSPRAIVVAGAHIWVSVDAPPISDRSAVPGGTLRMDTTDPLNLPVDDLDPALAYSSGGWQVLYATCAKLLNYPDRSGPSGSQLTPEVASGLPSVTADGRTYTFTIRSGFRFSPPSAQAVTAQTFKTTIERTLNPKMKSPIAYEFANVVGAAPYIAARTNHISGVQARGNKLIIRLLTPQPDLPSRLAQPFFCAVPTNTPIDPAGVRVIPSAGPYYVTSYTPGQSVVLVRNPNYRGSRPHRLGRIVLALGISSPRAVADITAGRADYTPIAGTPASTISALAARLATRYGPASPAAAHHRQQYFVESQHPELDFLILNTHRRLFSDRRLRQAVNYAIDRHALARLAEGYGTAVRPTSQYLPPGMPGHSPSAIYPLTPDLAKARALASGHGRTAVLYTCNYAVCRQQAQIVSDDLAAIGLRVEIKIFDHATLYARFTKPNEPFDIGFATWLIDYPDPASMLNGMLAATGSYPTFNDPKYQRELAAVGQLSGPKRYLAFGKLALRLARDAAPIVAYGNEASQVEFFSPRIGCQTYSFYVGVDLASLCTRRQHR